MKNFKVGLYIELMKSVQAVLSFHLTEFISAVMLRFRQCRMDSATEFCLKMFGAFSKLHLPDNVRFCTTLPDVNCIFWFLASDFLSRILNPSLTCCSSVK